MPEIHVLDQNTINQIAAGEVIERPASVVKELVENAIDAGANAVTVEIREGGLSLIRVTDNGCGIEGSQIRTAFLPHATSKIMQAADLLHVSSLGFRGEALASIASVSKVELITKTSSSISGYRYRIEGGQETGMEEIGAPDGTTFIARELFYNTPARRKFLRSGSTEASHVAGLTDKLALSHPNVSIRLISNGQTKLHTSGNGRLEDMIYSIYGKEIAANLIRIKGGADPVRISGVVGKPIIARAGRGFENCFINGRYVRNPVLTRAIEDAYKPYMMQHRFPFTMLMLEIDPGFIDVNVHPAKLEVRFRDDSLIYRSIFHTLSVHLHGGELIPEAGEDTSAETGEASLQDRKTETKEATEAGTGARSLKAVPFNPPHIEPFEIKRRAGSEEVPDEVRRLIPEPEVIRETPVTGAVITPRADFTALLSKDKNAEQTREESQTAGERQAAHEELAAGDSQMAGGTQASADDRQQSMFDGRLLSPEARKRHRLIGQIFDTYWLIEYDDSLYIVDQHAAHEKVLYERTMASLANRSYTSQMLNPPLILTLTGEEIRVLEQYADSLHAIGFEIESFGGNDYAVRAVPDNLFSVAKKELLLEMLDSLTPESGMTATELLNHRVATMSCKAAIKGGHVISRQEAEHLIDELMTLDNPYACPHGRPTIIKMSRYELEKKFKRIV